MGRASWHLGTFLVMLVDLLTMRPDIRQRLVQLLDEIEGGNDEGDGR